MSSRDNLSLILNRCTVRAIRRIIAGQFREGFPLYLPVVNAFTVLDTNHFLERVSTIIDSTQDRGWFRSNSRFEDHLTFYARLYRVALECIYGYHADGLVPKLLLTITPDDFDHLCVLESAMTHARI